MGRLFGPLTATWVFMLALSGLVHVLGRPDVLAVLEPRYALAFLTHHPGHGTLAGREVTDHAPPRRGAGGKVTSTPSL